MSEERDQERRWKTIEISEKLGVSPDRLLDLSKGLRKRGEVTPRSSGGFLWWSDADLDRLRRRIREKQEQDERERALIGLKTWEVAAELGLSEERVLFLRHRYRIEVSRSGRFLVWEEAAVEALRAILAQNDGEKAETLGDGTARLAGGDAAKKLGISYQKLYRLVRAHNVPVKREGDRILWDEEAVNAVSGLLGQLAAKESIATAEGMEELGTIAVCRKLGIEYVTLLSLITPFRKDLKLTRRGRLLVWPPEAVARVEEALRIRRQKADGDLLSRAEQLRLQLKQRLADVEETATELSTPPAMNSFISTLPSGGSHILQFPLAVLVYTLRSGFRAVLTEIELEASGQTPHKAIRNLRVALWARYCASLEAPDDPESAALAQLIIPVD